ncbi:MAG: hypothetical protein ACKOOG_05360 [Actinomycetota bacterium]
MPTTPPVPTRRGTRDERGSIIVSVGVMMVLTLLSAAVVARTVAGMKSARQGQDFSAALAAADAGVSDALFRIDQLGSASATAFCVGPNPACTVQAVPGAPGVEYSAQRISSNSYRIRSKGTVNGQLHAVEAIVTRAFDYPYAIFTRVSLSFNGNTGNYNAVTGVGPIQTVDASNNVVLDPQPVVASNGQISCHGSTSPAARQNYYRGGGTNCANSELLDGAYNPKDPTTTCPAPANVPPTPCRPANAAACPAVNGTLPGSLLPGAYSCTQADLAPGTTLRFPSVFTVGSGAANGGVVELFVIPTNGTSITVSIADAIVNQGGDASRLRVYLAGGRIDPGNGAHSGDFTGILYAPSAAEVNPSCGADWRGSLVLQAFTCNGGPHLQVRYDTRIRSVVSSSWSVTDYTEIPSNRVTLP